MKKSDLNNFIKTEILSSLKEGPAEDKAAQDAKKIAIDKEIIALKKKKQEVSKQTSTLAESDERNFKITPLGRRLFKQITDLYNDPNFDNNKPFTDTYLDEFFNDDKILNLLKKMNLIVPYNVSNKIDEMASLSSKGKDASKDKKSLIDLPAPTETEERYRSMGMSDMITRKVDWSKDAVSSTPSLKEMARLSSNIILGNANKAQKVKDAFKDKKSGIWISKMIDTVASAGTEGISQPALAASLGKLQQSINNQVKELIAAGIFKQLSAPTPKSLPKTKKSDFETPSEPKDDFYTADKDFTSSTDDGPKQKDIAAAEKSIKTSGGKYLAKPLTPDEEIRYNKIKKGIEMLKAKRDFNTIRAIIKKPEVINLFKAKGVNIKDLINE